jgi:hypothetical protein
MHHYLGTGYALHGLGGEKTEVDDTAEHDGEDVRVEAELQRELIADVHVRSSCRMWPIERTRPSRRHPRGGASCRSSLSVTALTHRSQQHRTPGRGCL